MSPTTREGADPLIAQDVWLRYKRSPDWALAGADGVVQAAAVTALVGPNGVGKTSLIRCWLGFEQPDRGQALVFGQWLSRDRDKAAHLVAHLPQEPALYTALSALDHFQLAQLERPSFDQTLAAKLLRDAEVSGDVAVGKLSGGQRMRVAIALVLATRARVVLLDEPLANLDPLARREVMALLADYADEHSATVLVSSHLVGELEGAFANVIVMARGRIVLSGPSASVVAEYRIRQLAADATPGDLQRQFLARDGSKRMLVPAAEAAADDRTPSLEDVVMGLLAEARARRDQAQ